MAVIDSRSSLVGALLRTAPPVNRKSIGNFLEGLSRDEIQCIVEFQGACIIESAFSESRDYRMLAEFFDSWPDSGERAHKTFIVLAWVDLRKSASQATISFALT